MESKKTPEYKARLSIFPCGEMAYPAYIEVGGRFGKIPFTDNLEPMHVDNETGKFFTSRGIARISNHFFLDMKVESSEGYVETEIIPASKTIILLCLYRKLELLEELGLQL